MGSNRGLEACRAELQEFFLRLARLRGRKREARLHLDGHHVVEDALNQAGGRHIVLERPRHHRVPVRRGLQQPARDGPVHARLDAIQHVHDHVLRERVLRVVHLLTPHVAGIDPQTNLRLGPDVLGSADQVPLVVAAQLSRGHPRRAGPEHRLHKVLRAGGGGHVTPDQVRPFGVGDFFVLEQVLVHAAEERLREGGLRARRMQLRRDDHPRVARVGAVLERRFEGGRILEVVDVRDRARVDLHDHHVLEEDLEVLLLLCDVEHHRDQAVLESLDLKSLGGEGTFVQGFTLNRAWKVGDPRRVAGVGSDDEARRHVLGQVHASRVLVAPRHVVAHDHVELNREIRCEAWVSVCHRQVELDLHCARGGVGGVRPQRDVELRELVGRKLRLCAPRRVRVPVEVGLLAVWAARLLER
mmetsp:Transcript_43775/g.103528  ORF Transcript_43775/g.103528 Transcript_43775/m.103528 type:complete len:414 (-) Transcript_43775:165-1406(-)